MTNDNDTSSANAPEATVADQSGATVHRPRPGGPTIQNDPTSELPTTANGIVPAPEAAFGHDASAAGYPEAEAAAAESESLGAGLPVRKCAWLLEAPQMLPGENPREFEAILNAIFDAVKPKDAIEEILCDDAANFVLELRRLRRCRAALHATEAQQALANFFDGFYASMDPKVKNDLRFGWARGDPEPTARVERQLAMAGHTVTSLPAEALARRIGEFERLDYLIRSNSIRRDAIFREVDRHRATLGQRFRQAVDDVEDVEFDVVEPCPGAGEDAT